MAQKVKTCVNLQYVNLQETIPRCFLRGWRVAGAGVSDHLIMRARREAHKRRLALQFEAKLVHWINGPKSQAMLGFPLL